MCFRSSSKRSAFNLFSSASYSDLISPGALSRGGKNSSIINTKMFRKTNKTGNYFMRWWLYLPSGTITSSPFNLTSISFENLDCIYSQSSTFTKFFCFVAVLSQDPILSRQRGQHKALFSTLPVKQCWQKKWLHGKVTGSMRID